MHWQTTRFCIDLGTPRVMGILNLTPDSFSDGGRLDSTRAALLHAERLLREGADLLDVGAESTRPGAPRVPPEEEWARLAPVLPELLRLGVPVSVDSCKTLVMARALELGVDVINDVQALQGPGAEACLAGHPTAGVVLMHMRGEPAQMQDLTDYADLATEVGDFLRARANRLQSQGVAAPRIVLDPGFGFAKRPQQNIALQRQLRSDLPWLAGWSRKSTIGWISGAPVAQRLPGSLAAALAAVQSGARVLRVHDVAETVQALRVWQAMQG